MLTRLAIAPLVLGALCIAPEYIRAADNFTCPVTKPDPSFVPPAPFAPHGSWLGTEKLWTLLDSRWGSLGPSDFGFKIAKVVWFSRDYDAKIDGQPALTLTGRRLDGTDGPGPIKLKVSGGYVEKPGLPRQNFMPSDVYLPTRGCWEMTAHYKTADLTFVVDVH